MAIATRTGVSEEVGRKPSNGPLLLIRAHPIVTFFVLALGLSWGWQIPLFAITHQSLLGPWVILGPSLAGFITAGLVEGRAGMLRLLRRLLIWRVDIQWYLVALLTMPLTWLAAVVIWAGGFSAFRAPTWAFALTYLSALGYSFLSAISVEEFGWRGFALPRMQKLLGPLVGTLILGLVWSLWHLPGWAFFPSATGAGSTLPLFIGSFAAFAMANTASAFVYTWVLNHTRGSVLLAGLIHGSTNAGAGTFLLLFPSLLPHATIPFAYEVGITVVALVIIFATRGQLGYLGREGESASSTSMTSVSAGI